jgi:hypothetical protein
MKLTKKLAGNILPCPFTLSTKNNAVCKLLETKRLISKKQYKILLTGHNRNTVSVIFFFITISYIHSIFLKSILGAGVHLVYSVASLLVFLFQSFSLDGLSSFVCIHLFYFVLIIFSAVT